MINGTTYCKTLAYLIKITKKYGLHLNKNKSSLLLDNLCKEGKGPSKRRIYGTECKKYDTFN